MIQKSQTADGLVTYDDFRSLVADGQKADLIDGVIYMASPDSKRSNKLNAFLLVLIDCYVAAKGIEGEVLMSRFACKINELRSPEPDVLYIVPERTHLSHENHMEGGPDIAVEIVSHESRGRDYGEKRLLYEQAGVTEYWIIDPLQSRCEFLRLKDGHYEIVPLEENRIFRSNVIPGFWLNVEWLLARKIPKAHVCLQQLLA